MGQMSLCVDQAEGPPWAASCSGPFLDQHRADGADTLSTDILGVGKGRRSSLHTQTPTFPPCPEETLVGAGIKESGAFPSLRAIPPLPLRPQELGNSLDKCKNNENLQQILTNATIMVVSVTASTTQGYVARGEKVVWPSHSR